LYREDELHALHPAFHLLLPYRQDRAILPCRTLPLPRYSSSSRNSITSQETYSITRSQREGGRFFLTRSTVADSLPTFFLRKAGFPPIDATVEVPSFLSSASLAFFSFFSAARCARPAA